MVNLPETVAPAINRPHQRTHKAHHKLVQTLYLYQLTNPKTCLLKTATATVSAKNIKTSANILFDEGAQRSLITAQLATELQIIPTASE